MPLKKREDWKYDTWRPKAIESPEKMLELFKAYRTITKANPILVHDFVWKDADEVERKKERPLTMVGFYNYCYEQVGSNPEHYFFNLNWLYDDFIGICSYIRDIVKEDQIAWGMAGIYNPSITQRLNGLVEKREVEKTWEAENKKWEVLDKIKEKIDKAQGQELNTLLQDFLNIK